MRKYLAPRIALSDLPVMAAVTLQGALLAGLYGIVHDQFTFAISPEYFTNMKFQQFHYADFGLGDRVFASTVGLLGTWWVGGILAWFLARRLVPGQSTGQARRQIGQAFLIVFAAGVAAGILGFAYGLACGPGGDYSAWTRAFTLFRIEDEWAFVRVAYIHNASYAGGALGFLLVLATIRPTRVSPRQDTRDDAE